MGNEMGNNNTSAIKEEDNISEAEKKTLLQDSSELANGISQDVDADSVNEENQPIVTSIAKDVTEKYAKASNDTTELGKDTWQEDSHEDDIKGEIQTVSTAESKDFQEKATWFASKNTTSMLSLKGDTHASDASMEENQMHPTAEAEDVQKKPTVVSPDCLAIEDGKDTLQNDSYADNVKEEIHVIPTAEVKDVQEEATGSISNNTSSMLENDSLEGYINASDVNIENQMNPEAEAEYVQEKATGLASEYYTISSLEKDLLKGDAYADDVNVDHEKHPTAESKDNQQISSKIAFDDKTSESQEDKHDAVVVIPMANGTDVQGQITNLASDDLLNLEKSFGLAVHEITETRQPENFPNDGLAEAKGENYDILSSTSLEGTEECEKQKESCLGKQLLILTYNHPLDNEPSIKQADTDKNTVLTLKAVDVSNDSELQDLSSVHSDHDELAKVLSKESHQANDESLQKDNFLHTTSHFEQIRDDVSEKEMESQEKMLCSYDYNLDHCMEETLQEFEASMVDACVVTVGSNGDFNGERNTELASEVSWIANSDQVREAKVTENGLQLEAVVNNYKASDETSIVSEQKHSVVPEAEMVFLIAGSTVVDCRHEMGENYKIKMEETNGNLEASNDKAETSEGTEIPEQCNSDLVTKNQEDSLTLQNSSSLLHIYNFHQGNAKQTESPTATSMPDSDWKQTNDNKYFGATIENLDSSNLEVASPALVDDEAFKNEGEDYSQHMQATSELTTSAAIMSSESCSNNSILGSGGYETREIIIRLSTESEPDNPNISSSIQKSPSFNLNLRTEATPEESDQAPLLYQAKLANESLSNQASLSLIKNSTSSDEYGQCMLQREEMPVEEKIVTMERSYSEKSKAPFIGLLKEEEEIHLLVMPHTEDNNAASKKAVKEVSSTSPKGKEKRKPRSAFFSSCMCCAPVAN